MKAAHIVSGLVFALIAIVHFARLYFQFPLIVGDYAVPLTANLISGILFALLSIWMFATAKNCRPY